MKPSRNLNEPSGIFGLGTWDICGVGYVFIISHSLLTKFGLELLSFLIAAFVAYALSVIRMNRRRRIIRDFLKHYFAKRGLYDSKTRPH